MPETSADERPHGGQERQRAAEAGTTVGTALGRALTRGGRGLAGGVARSVRAGVRGGSRAGRYTYAQARRASRAEGAGDSGLFRLIELHAFHAAGDTAVAIGLAGTLFFGVPTGEARSQVALFLGLTMLPFAIVAPFIGPLLDRFSHGRRWAIGATTAVRGFLCWVLAAAVVTDSPALFPAALGCLVASKAYLVTRSAAVPRLLPERLTLVRANARTSLAGVVGAAVSAPLAGAAALAGPEWALRYGFGVFVVATVLAVLLPARADASTGEDVILVLPGPESTARPGRRGRSRLPSPVVFTLQAGVGPRFLSGFLTMFLAFLLREQPVPGWRPELLLGLVIAAAGLGNATGVALASVLRRVPPRHTVVLVLALDVVLALLATVWFGIVSLVLLGLGAGVSQSLAKLSLDSTIQQYVPERVQTSAFARGDLVLQLAWVVGGFAGIALPLVPALGLGTACGVLAGWLALLLVVARAAGPGVAGFDPPLARE